MVSKCYQNSVKESENGLRREKVVILQRKSDGVTLYSLPTYAQENSSRKLENEQDPR
ncbi:hypothetical protein GCM10027291_48870 [Telluribacter humicola]